MDASRTGPLRRDRQLVCDDVVLADAHMADTRAERRRGLLGRDQVDGVMVLPVRSVHTVGMQMPIDVAFCNDDGEVLRVVTMVPHRVGRPCMAARMVIEAPAGAFAAWGIGAGSRIELR